MKARHQAEERSEVMRDLDRWTKEQHAKDRALMGEVVDNPSKQDEIKQRSSSCLGSFNSLALLNPCVLELQMSDLD